ncbi:MAG: hypothetical protein KF722_05675 [Nitrospira sp.]|nr:hypothetical protein [Nitrospira sp.]
MTADTLQRLWDFSRIPYFRPTLTVPGIVSAPKPLVVSLQRWTRGLRDKVNLCLNLLTRMLTLIVKSDHNRLLGKEMISGSL